MDFKLFNIALLVKQDWRLLKNHTSLYFRMMKSFYSLESLIIHLLHGEVLLKPGMLYDLAHWSRG